MQANSIKLQEGLQNKASLQDVRSGHRDRNGAPASSVRSVFTSVSLCVLFDKTLVGSAAPLHLPFHPEI